MQDSPYMPNSRTTTVTNNYSTGLGTFWLGALLVLLGIVAGAAIVHWLGVKTVDPVKFDAIEQLLQPNGDWKPTGNVKHYRTMPDGSVQVQQSDGTWLTASQVPTVGRP